MGVKSNSVLPNFYFNRLNRNDIVSIRVTSGVAINNYYIAIYQEGNAAHPIFEFNGNANELAVLDLSNVQPSMKFQVFGYSEDGSQVAGCNGPVTSLFQTNHIPLFTF